MIIIHYDFTDESEISYMEGCEKGDDFTTHCLNFFCFDYSDVKIVKANGDYIVLKELLDNTGEYTDREIRFGHNAMKMLIADCFKWKNNT